MRAIVMDGFGPPTKARMADLPMPGCSDCDVLIKVACAGVNPVDWKECEGHLEQFYGAYDRQWIPGYDAAGIVHAVGPLVKGFKRGDRVVAFSDRRENGHNGTFAEYVRVLASAISLVPDAVALADAAAIPTAALTGYQAIHRANKAGLTAGKTLLIHGASGGVGSYAVQMAKAAGLLVVATCSERNLNYVRSLGADIVLDYAVGALAPSVRQWNQTGLDAIVDCVSGGSLVDAFEILRPGGKLVNIATLTSDGDIAKDAEAAARLGFAKIFSIMEFDRIDIELNEILQLMEKGAVRPPPLTIYPLDQAALALQHVKQGAPRGKTILDMSAL